MVEAKNLVEVAALVGDTTRAAMLHALMGGQALTAAAAYLDLSKSELRDRLHGTSLAALAVKQGKTVDGLGWRAGHGV